MLKTKTTSNNYETDMENKVEKLLENINGISKVSVVISFKSGSEKILQEDGRFVRKEKMNLKSQQSYFQGITEKSLI